MKNIDRAMEQVWNERMKKTMEERKLTQRSFISKYKERFGTGSQADVSKWMHVGEIYGKKKKPRGFPEFETMKNIAEILDVSVGYLIGDIDAETYDLEQASSYIGVSAKTILAMQGITSGKAIPPFNNHPDQQRNAALELLLEAPSLVDYLRCICDIAEIICRKQPPKRYFEEAQKIIPIDYQDDAVAFWENSKKAIERGIQPTEDLLAYVKFLDNAADRDMNQMNVLNREESAARYSLQETHTKMISEILTPETISRLLLHYPTKKDIKTIKESIKMGEKDLIQEDGVDYHKER